MFHYLLYSPLFHYSLQNVASADPTLADSNYGLGLLYIKLQKYSMAKEYFDKALKYEPIHIKTLLHLGYLHYIQKNYTKAVALFKKIPQSELFSTKYELSAPSILVNCYIQLGHLQAARELLELMLTQDSQQLQVKALNGLGMYKYMFSLLMQCYNNKRH